MGKLTDDWKYEKPEWESDSQLKDRALFLAKILELKPQVITDLYLTVFNSFLSFAIKRFGKKFLADIPVPSNPSRSDLYRYLWNIPEEEVKIATLTGWSTLQHRKGTKELRVKLQEWAQKQNLTAVWCLDHAVRVLRHWMYDNNVRLLDATPPAFQTPEWLAGELSSVWQNGVNRIKFDLAYSRAALASEVFQGEKGDPAPFVFERDGLRFETDGWNYLQEGSEEWKKSVEQEFDRYIVQIKVKDQPVPKGILTALRDELPAYVKKQDAEKLVAIKQHGLVKRSRRYAEHSPEDHIKWLVMYQIPPCKKYSEISELANKAPETVRKFVGATAKKIELKLRDDRLHAGRRPGESGKSPHRVTYREKFRRQKRNAEK